MSSQHEANILGGCTEDTRYIHGGYTLHPRKGTLKTGNSKQSRDGKLTTETILCSHRGHSPAISRAGSNLLSPTSFGTHSAKVLIGSNEGRLRAESCILL